jgi:transcriptional repressor NrdR
MIDKVEADIYSRRSSEVSSAEIGEMITLRLKDLDPVAYVRFASVYREFKDVGTFMDELRTLIG